MTEPSPSRPVPSPPRRPLAGVPTAHAAGGSDDSPQTTTGTPPAEGTPDAAGEAAGATSSGETRRPYADLDQRPVAEHVEVFEAEHARLQDELSTIDRL